MTSSKKWQLVKVTDESATSQRSVNGTWMLGTTPGLVIYKQVVPYTTREQLLIYRSGAMWVAQLTGTEGKDVTSRLPQPRWEELYSMAQAVLALTGSVHKLPLQEIF
jgi:hypothetical protein